MKRILLSAVMLLTFLVSPGQSNDAGRHVQDLAKKKFGWMVRLQTDSLEAVLDDRLKYIHSNGLTQTKTDVLDDLKSGKLTYKDIQIAELDVRVFNSTAIVVGKAIFSGVNNTTPFNVNLLFTEVYILKNKAWVLASRHASKLP